MHAQLVGGDPALAAGDVNNTDWLGHALVSRDFLLPFEIAAVILTVGVVAAVVLTLRDAARHALPESSRQVARSIRARSPAHGEDGR